MPELHRNRNWRITLYADDHPPPHFHVQCPDGEAQVAIETCEVLEPEPEALKKSLKVAIAEATAWARANRERLNAEWFRLNRRNTP